MALTNMPRGLSPYGTLTGAAYNEMGRLYAVPVSDTTHSYSVGDIVVIATGGDSNGISYVGKWVAGSAPPPLGVIVGVRVSDPGVSLVAANLDLTTTYIVAGTRTAIRYVYVVDDPNVLFYAQFDATGLTQNQMSNLCSATQVANSSPTPSAPLSTTVLTGPVTAYTANTSVFQILNVNQDPINQGGISSAATAATAVPYLSVLVTWNQHQLKAVGFPGV